MHSHRVDETTMVKPRSNIGAYHPRIWRGQSRPSDPFRAFRPIDPRSIGASSYVDSIVAARSLFDRFEALCRAIQPAKVNFTTYGHHCRELLLLVCTEVEAALRGVLVANNGAAPGARLSTNHYVHLLKPLGLADWCVTLRDYPDIGELRPFRAWSVDAPTKSLGWYDDYNAVKHDRELSFSRATFGSVLFALAALHILLGAQWGPEIFSAWFEAERSPFLTEQVPVWSPAEMYSPPLPGTAHDKWAPTPYFPASAI